MPSVITHALLGAALGSVFLPANTAKRFWVAVFSSALFVAVEALWSNGRRLVGPARLLPLIVNEALFGWLPPLALGWLALTIRRLTPSRSGAGVSRSRNERTGSS